MVKLSTIAALSTTIFASTSAFTPPTSNAALKSLSLASSVAPDAETDKEAKPAPPAPKKKKEPEIWDPMSFHKLGTGKSFDTFPNMFPHMQFLQEAETKHARACMLAWTGIWATHKGGMGLGMHIPGMPDEPDWTKAFGVFAAEQPGLFGAIVLFIAISEGESVGHTGDNYRGKSTKTPGDLGYDMFAFKSKLGEERLEHYKTSELTNGRAAMIGMASMFAFESIPGSVPLMDLFGAY